MHLSAKSMKCASIMSRAARRGLRSPVANQGMENKLLKVREAEQLGSGGHRSGFWKCIIGSQDEAGWVIIISLAIMAVINWVVMIGKGVLYPSPSIKTIRHF